MGDYHGYDPHHYAGWASAPAPIVRPNLTSDELLKVSSFLDALDESGANFSGVDTRTVKGISPAHPACDSVPPT